VLYARGGSNKLGHLKTRNGSCFEKKKRIKNPIEIMYAACSFIGQGSTWRACNG
jgi:hypothetical protein